MHAMVCHLNKAIAMAFSQLPLLFTSLDIGLVDDM